MISKKPIIIANWKASNPIYKDSFKKINSLFKNLAKDKSKIDLIFAPNFLQIQSLKKDFKKSIQISSQDISIYNGGSYTGEITAESVKDTGATYTIIGHSERRAAGDNNKDINQKIKNALAQKLGVVFCIGEKERDDGVMYLKYIEEQILSAFEGVDKKALADIIIAYEPIWAINNKNNQAIDANGLHRIVVYIRKILLENYGEAISKNINILYGGSVTPDNAQDILWNGEVQGLLIGRASWEVDSFVSIIKKVIINPKKK